MPSRRAFLASAVARLLGVAVSLFSIAGCATTAAPGDPVTFRRTGGLAGTTVELAIDADGQATLSVDGHAREFAVQPDRLEALHEALHAADLEDLAPPPGSGGGPGRDLFEYEITYRGQTVRTRDTQVPPELAPVLSALNAIVAEERDAD